MISQWEHHIPAITCDEEIRCHSTRIYLFYFDDNFRRYSLWVRPLWQVQGGGGSPATDLPPSPTPLPSPTNRQNSSISPKLEKKILHVHGQVPQFIFSPRQLAEPLPLLLSISGIHPCLKGHNAQHSGHMGQIFSNLKKNRNTTSPAN